MTRLLPTIGALLLSVFLFLLGHGVFTFLVPVRLDLEGVGRGWIGAMTSAYYLGYVGGALVGPGLVERVGHIRAFASVAGLAAAALLAHGLWVGVVPWLAWRFLVGVALAVLLLVVESWLNGRSPAAVRGRVLSVYLGVFYLALGVGQLVAAGSDPLGAAPFMIGAAAVSLAVVPVALTRFEPVAAPTVAHLGTRSLVDRAPLGVLGCTVAGMIMGSFYGLGPVFGLEVGLGVAEVGRLMAVTLFAGLLLQWPVGHLSDRYDRRAVLGGVATATGPAALFLAAAGAWWPALVLPAALLFGGLATTLWPLGVSHVADRVEHDELVGASGTLVLVNGLGAIGGPLGGALAMHWIGPGGLFVFIALAGLGTGAYTVVRLALYRSGPQAPYVSTRPLLLPDLDPRTEPSHEGEPPAP